MGEASKRTSHRARWIPRLQALGSSYWLVPALMALASVALAFLMLHVDRALIGGDPMPWIYEGDAAGARAVLGAIASSMITVAGVVYSITLVPLSLASQQFGPMLLRSYAKDRPNQVVLGTFIATFLYCLFVARSVRTGDDGFVPHSSITVAIVLAVASIGVLIFFIHHIVRLIRVEQVLARIADELDHAAERLYPIRHPNSRETRGRRDLPWDFERGARTIHAEEDGYLQVIADGKLVELAQRNDLIIEAMRRPHDFIVRGIPILRTYPAASCDDATAAAMVDAMVIGREPETQEDLRMQMDQLVQLALRALSPSLNDPVTARVAMDRITGALARVARGAQPSERHYDAEGSLRVIIPRTTLEQLIDRTFDAIRRNAGRQSDVVSHLLDCVIKLAPSLREPAHRHAARHLVHRIERTARDEMLASDLPFLEPLLERAAHSLKEPPRGSDGESER